jgi:hypothetical protein
MAAAAAKRGEKVAKLKRSGEMVAKWSHSATTGMSASDLVIVLIALVYLLLFGAGYALFITLDVFPAWLRPARVTARKVVIGCALTNLGVSALLYALTHTFWPVLALWAGYAITGLPMWIMQEYKRLVQNEIAEVEDGRD